MGSRYDMENHLFEKGLTIREVNKIMNESKGKSHKKRCEKCKPASERSRISQKNVDEKGKVYCEYCDKDISVAYYKSHLNTLNHLANVGRNMVNDEKKKENDEKKKEKKQVKKHNFVRENELRSQAKSKIYEKEDTDEEIIEKGLSSQSDTEDENSESSGEE